jgi:WD40 repeat protein
MKLLFLFVLLACSASLTCVECNLLRWFLNIFNGKKDKKEDNNNFITIDGAKYLPCNANRMDQVSACQMHCSRQQNIISSDCTILNAQAICKCIEKISTQSTVNTTSTMTLTDDGITELYNIRISDHRGWVYSLVVLPNGDLASGTKSAKILIWDPVSYLLKNALIGHMEAVRCLTLLPNGDLASGSEDQSIKIWNTSSRALKRTLSGHDGWVYSLAVLKSGAGEKLASASRDGTIKIWNVTSGMVLLQLLNADLTRPSSSVYSLAILPNGYLASGDYGGSIKIWNPESGSLINTIVTGSVDVWCMAVLHDDDSLASSYIKNNTFAIQVWNHKSGQLIRTLVGHTSAVFSLIALQSKVGDLASGSGDRTIKIWNVTTNETKATFIGHGRNVFSLAMLKSGLLASGGRDKTIRIWNVSQTLNKRIN